MGRNGVAYVAVAVLVIVAVGLLVGLGPVRPGRVARFLDRHRLPPDTDPSRVVPWLARTRRLRTAGAVLASIASLFVNVASGLYAVALGSALAGWLVGALVAIVAEGRHRLNDPAGNGVVGGEPVPGWLRGTPWAVAVAAGLTTAGLLVLRPEAPAGHIAFRAGLVVTLAIAVGVAARAVARRTPGDPVDRAIDRDDVAAVAAVTILLVGVEVTEALPASTPYGSVYVRASLSGLVILWAVLAVGLALFVLAAARPGRPGTLQTPGVPRRSSPPRWLPIAMAAALALASVAWIALAGRDPAPYPSSAVNPRATLTLTAPASFEADAAALGMPPGLLRPIVGGQRSFVGRLDVDPPPVQRTSGQYLILVVGERTGTFALTFGPAGSGWGPVIEPLVARYPWLSMLRADTVPSAAMYGSGTRDPMFFSGTINGGSNLTAADLTVVLLFVGPANELYWATRVTPA